MRISYFVVFFFSAITLSFTFHLLLFAIFLFVFFFLSFHIHIIAILFFIMANIKDIEGEGIVQGNGPPQFNDNLIFKLLESIFTRLYRVHLRVLSCLLTNKLWIWNRAWFNFFPHFTVWILKIHTYTLRTLKRYVIPLLIEHAQMKPFGLNCSHSL